MAISDNGIVLWETVKKTMSMRLVDEKPMTEKSRFLNIILAEDLRMPNGLDLSTMAIYMSREVNRNYSF